jgi:hypothetical protein
VVRAHASAAAGESQSERLNKQRTAGPNRQGKHPRQAGDDRGSFLDDTGDQLLAGRQVGEQPDHLTAGQDSGVSAALDEAGAKQHRCVRSHDRL